MQVKEKMDLKGGVAGSRPLIVAGIPAFNEERMIAKVVLEARKFVDWVIVCDDGSNDLTAEIAERLGADVIRHEKNLGYGAALRSLFEKAQELGADAMVTLDGDGQHNPSEIPMLMEPVLHGKADVAIGSRFLGTLNDSNGVPEFRRLGIRVITKLTGAVLNHGLSDAQSGFRVYGLKALQCLNMHEDGMGVSIEALLEARKQGLTIVEIPAGCNYKGLERTSACGSFRHGTSVIASIIRLVVEDRPLLLLGIPGVLSLLIGVFFGVWMLEIYAVEQRIATNIALASIAFILIGFFAVFTAITLYAIARLAKKMNSK
jgi:glycosyltransferase involved in cell wall biosynthesis